MRTIAQHIDLIEHALGATPDSRLDLYHMLNRAGRILTRRRKWWWRLVPNVSLPAVAGSVNISLPSDFDTLDTMVVSGSGGKVLTLTPEQYTLSNGTSNPLVVPEGYAMDFSMAVVLPISTFHATTGAETKVLKLLEIASANGTPTLVMSYYRSWREVDSGDDNAVAAIPEDFDDALMLIARACAKDLQDEADCIEMQRYEQEITQLESADTARVPSFAAPAGGASRMRKVRLDGPMSFN